MHPDRDHVIRVGLRLVIVALVAGLLVLLFNPAARSAENPAPSAHEALLLQPQAPVTTDERVDRAEGMLRREKRRRIGSLTAHVIDLGARAALQVSPRRLLRGVRDVARDLWTWRDRSHAEDRALALLEAEHRAGALDESAAELYADLRGRERDVRAERLIAQSEAALEAGRTWRARRALARALALQRDDDRLADLARRVAEAEVAAVPARNIDLPFRADRSEVALSAALLSDRFARVDQLAGDRPDAQLARAASHYLDGDRAAALAAFARLAEREDSIGATARAWLADTNLNPGIELDRELARYRRQQRLGWVGGPALAESALAFDSSGYAAWRETLSPMNLVISAPARVLRGWHPDAAPLRAAAERYLELLPDGPRATEARAWLDELPLDARTARGARIWDDGVLVLPAARTDYGRAVPRPILVTLDALSGARRLELGLGMELQGADAVLLTFAPDADADVLPLPAAQGLVLISELATGLESHALRAGKTQGQGEVLEALRRLDTGLRAGWLVAAEPWIYVDDSETTVSLQHALTADGTEAPTLRERLSEGVAMAQGRKDVRISRPLLQAVECPADTWCIDRARRVEGDLFARVEVDGEVRVGAATRFADASLALEFNGSGAEASVSLPLARWLGLDRWIPLEANVGIGLDGLTLGTRPLEDEPTDEY